MSALCALLPLLPPPRSGKELGYAEQRRSWTHEVFFGLNAAVLHTGTIRVGDPVVVMANA